MGFLNFRRVLLLALLLGGMSACKKKSTSLKSPPGYDFEKVATFKLELKIKEISGLVWDPVKNVFITHIDESGKLFYLNRDTKKIVGEFRFADKGDFEDIALVGETPYVLESNGKLFKVIEDTTTKTLTGIEQGKLEIDGKVDFETMYYDSARHALVMICKNCDIDNKATVSAFAYYLDSTGFDNKPLYTIDASKVEKMAPKETSKLQPSAARIQPNLKKLFIISSAANLLVVADLNGVVESVHWLKPKIFPQPEGLAFNKSGDMYIANEGVTSNATILLFTAHGDARREK